MNKNVLITGGAGYLGSKLSTKLVNSNYKVTVLDCQMYSNTSLDHLIGEKNFTFINGDVRNKKLMRKILKNQKYIIPLAALVGAPLCEKNKKLATQINYDAIKLIVKNTTSNQKIIMPSTESGYGKTKSNEICDENTPVNPISHYGITKLNAEKIVIHRKNSIVFRLGTVFGISYRFRSDLLVNNLVLNALKNKKLEIFEGYYRRNFVHIDDVINCFLFAIKNFKILKNNIYNLGLGSGNVNKIELAQLIKKEFQSLRIIENKKIKDPDQRDYSVSSKMLEKKGFKATITLSTGIRHLINFLNKKNFSKSYNY